VLIDSNCLNDLLRFRPGKIDGPTTRFFKIRAQHLHPLREHEGALEVARRDGRDGCIAGPLSSCLAAPDHEPGFLNGYIELIAGETRHGPGVIRKVFRAGPLATVAPLDIVRRITVGAFDDAIEAPPLDFRQNPRRKRTSKAKEHET